MLRAVDLTLDCGDAGRLAAFWKTAVGYVDEPPPAPFTDRAASLVSFGEEMNDGLGGAWLIDPAGVAPRLSLLEVPEPKIAKNRLHMDLRVSTAETPDERWRQVQAETSRLVAAGTVVLVEIRGTSRGPDRP